jgi:NAD(P)H dehydrogenase (quinone)
MVYAVTGATGHFGTLAVEHLLQLKVPASSIVAVVRNEAKASHLKTLGVTVRVADYADKTALDRALKGVDRLLLVSGSEPGKRLPQHTAVIDAAKTNGVKLIAYTSISQADTSSNPLAPEHKGTEAYLKQSGVPFVFLRDNWYTENYADDVKYAKTSGVIANASPTGRVASANRTEYAEAAARVLIGEGHAGKIYELTGPVAWNFEEFAAAASEVLGTKVTYHKQTADERTKALIAAGLPEGIAGFVLSLDLGTEAGTLAKATGDLEKLLGRKPLTLKEGLKLLLK